MIASYNGMQDSQHLGSLMKGHDFLEEKVLLDLVMCDLAVSHRKDIEGTIGTSMRIISCGTFIVMSSSLVSLSF
jgi:hypothetical protein